MRFLEFANAEEQLGLLRVIIDNTWTAIEQQAEEQKKAQAMRKASSKPKAPTAKPIKLRPVPQTRPKAPAQPIASANKQAAFTPAPPPNTQPIAIQSG